MNTDSPPADLAAPSPESPLAGAPIPVDRINELYRGEIFSDESARIARDRIHWMCAQVAGDRVLDVGCSQGITALLLAREGCEVTAIDTHPDSIEYARVELARETPLVQGRVTLVEIDLAGLPEEPAFDTIVLGEVLEHQALPERFLRAAMLRLKPGGRLVVTTPFALHPHPDHKISLFPSHIESLARGLGLTLHSLDVVDHYIRAVLCRSADGTAAGPRVELLALTERATLESQQRLYNRLDERGEQLKKKTDALKIAQRKLAEATTGAAEIKTLKARHDEALAALKGELGAAQRKLAEANGVAAQKVQAHAAELKGLQARHGEALAALQSELASVQRRLDGAKAAAAQKADADAAQLHSLQAQLEAAEKSGHAHRHARTRLETELETARGEARATWLAHEREVARLKERNERLKERLGSLKESMLGVKASSSYRLGRQIVRGVKSPRAFLALPGELIRLGRDVLARRRARAALLAQVDGSEPSGLRRPAAKAGPAATAPSHGRASRARAPKVPGGAKDAGLPSVESLRDRLDREGLGAVQEQLRALRKAADGRALALKVLQFGKAAGETSGSEVEFAIAETALEFDRSEATLRGYFWAAQRTRHFEPACRAIRELERCYGDSPSADQQAMLDKLRISPAYQLSALELILERPRATVQRVPGRIAYVLHNSLPYSSGGYATRSHGVAEGLKAAGREVVIVTRPGFPVDIKPELTDADVPAEDVIDGIRYLRTRTPLRRGISMLRYVTEAADALERQLLDVRPELVISASNHVTALPALIAARRLGLPFVYEVRGLWEITRISREQEFEDTPAFAVQSLLEAKVAQLADHVFTLTAPMVEELVGRGVPADKIGMLPNSCDPDRFLPRPRDRALAERLGIPEGVPVIGYIGTFVDYEGLEDLTHACALLKQRGVVFRLMLVGNENASGAERGPITGQILQIASEHELSDWLIMPGRVPHEEVESYYSLIDIAPFPRKPWPVCEMVSPMKPLEALAMEKAVLVSSVRALTEMIQDGVTGRVFDKGSIASLAEQLQALIAEPALRARLGRQGREWVCRERTWNRIGQRIVDTLGARLGVRATGARGDGDAVTAAPPRAPGAAPARDRHETVDDAAAVR